MGWGASDSDQILTDEMVREFFAQGFCLIEPSPTEAGAVDGDGSDEVDFGIPGDKEIVQLICHELDDGRFSSVFEGFDQFSG